MLRVILVAAALTTPLMSGCGRNFKNENDILRAKVLDLEDDLTALRQRNSELETELAQAAAAPDSLPEAVRENTPHVAAIEVGRLSHPRDETGDRVLDTMIVYVHPLDGRGRFVQMVGDLAVHVALLPADREATTIGQVTLSPGELREAYRSGIGGTHYTIRVPLTMDAVVAAGVSEADVVVAFTDGHTNRKHEAHRPIALRE